MAHLPCAVMTINSLCEHPERGARAALSPNLARTDVSELVNYKSQMLPFMPGQRTADKELLDCCQMARCERKCWRAQGIFSCATFDLGNDEAREGNNAAGSRDCSIGSAPN